MYKCQSGFSLIELGIVLGVTAILSTTMVPTLVSSMRMRLTTQMIEEVNQAKDAAQNYYIQHRRWPGQADDEEGGCVLSQEENGMNILQMAGYLPRQPRDPWSDENFELAIEQRSDGEDTHCILNLKTADHQNIAQVLPKIETLLGKHFGMQCRGDNEEENRRCSFQFAAPKLHANIEALIDTRVGEIEMEAGKIVPVKLVPELNSRGYAERFGPYNNWAQFRSKGSCQEGYMPIGCTGVDGASCFGDDDSVSYGGYASRSRSRFWHRSIGARSTEFACEADSSKCRQRERRGEGNYAECIAEQHCTIWCAKK
jgi:type II secretory pathway pseudopilin PulG